MPFQRHAREHIELPSRVHRDVAEEGRPDRAETLRFDLGSVGCFCALLQAARERNGRSGDGLERPTYPAFWALARSRLRDACYGISDGGFGEAGRWLNRPGGT